MGKREEEGAGEAGLRAHRATRLGQGVGVGGPQVNSAETLQHLDDCLGKRLHQDGRPFCMKSGPTVTRSQGGTAGQVGWPCARRALQTPLLWPRAPLMSVAVVAVAHPIYCSEASWPWGWCSCH